MEKQYKQIPEFIHSLNRNLHFAPICSSNCHCGAPPAKIFFSAFCSIFVLSGASGVFFCVSPLFRSSVAYFFLLGARWFAFLLFRVSPLGAFSVGLCCSFAPCSMVLRASVGCVFLWSPLFFQQNCCHGVAISHSLTKEMLKKSVCMKNLALGPHGAASKPRFKGFCYCCLLFSFCFLTHKLSFSRFRALGFSLISSGNFIFDGFSSSISGLLVNLFGGSCRFLFSA